MKKIFFCIGMIIFIMQSFNAYSHSGRTNSEGCHNVKKTGGYHCHGSGSSPKINKNSNDSNQNDTSEIVLRKFKNRYCYDGDTCYVTINGVDTKIRLLELDTPEISKPKCEQELEWGLQARDYVNNLIANAKTVEIITRYQKDFFGRTLAYLIIDGENVSALLVKNNLGVVYKKGHKMDWCVNLN